MRKATVTSPARNGTPAAFASSARSRRRSASPELPLTEPSVPIGVPPAVMSVPEGGRGPSPSTPTMRFRAVPRCSMRDTTS